MSTSPIRMTEYSHGAGCGCKIAPAVLDVMLQSQLPPAQFPALLVGNDSRDDAAVYDLGNGTAVISTTDFFMPIVDDAFTFGRIAATNAISDIYAMGGKPLLAIAIFGWPLDKLPAEVGQQVIEGGRKACLDAGIPLAGGHSIDSPEPIFGLAVTGIVSTSGLKRNDTATVGNKLYITKPLGIGILTTAQKQKKLLPEHAGVAESTMCQLNTFGEQLSTLAGVKALTDITGFGLAGHLREMCQGSGVQAKIQFEHIPLLSHVKEYLQKGCSPGGAKRNFASYGGFLGEMTEEQMLIMCDPQTSGGLLIAVEPESESTLQVLATQHNQVLYPIGELYQEANKPLIVLE
ncbi:MAG: selenide, water dikinase SelD [Pseudomonadota bacterium]|jgi:selenide,water dikinase